MGLALPPRGAQAIQAGIGVVSIANAFPTVTMTLSESLEYVAFPRICNRAVVTLVAERFPRLHFYARATRLSLGWNCLGLAE